MSSALLATRQGLERRQASLERDRDRVVFVAGGPHASGDAAGTLAMGFDVVFIGEGERSFTEFLHRLAEPGRDFSDIRGLALPDRQSGKLRVIRTGRAAPIELDPRYPSIGMYHRRLWALHICRPRP